MTFKHYNNKKYVSTIEHQNMSAMDENNKWNIKNNNRHTKDKCKRVKWCGLQKLWHKTIAKFINKQRNKEITEKSTKGNMLWRVSSCMKIFSAKHIKCVKKYAKQEKLQQLPKETPNINYFTCCYQVLFVLSAKTCKSATNVILKNHPRKCCEADIYGTKNLFFCLG